MGQRPIPPRHVVITGAGSGIGAALARHYAGPGIRLSLLSRNVERLDAIAALCRARGAEVAVRSGDVADGDAMAAWLTGCDAAQPVDLVIANAGMGGELVLAGDSGEDLATAGRIVATNVQGVMNSIIPLLPRLIARSHGGVVIISSLAGLVPLANSPVYCATKAAVRTYGLSLYRLLVSRGLTVTVASPGFIDTPMSASLGKPLPFLWTAERAASHIARGVGRREIIFPWQLALAVRLAALLPQKLGGQDSQGTGCMTITLSQIDRKNRQKDWLAVPHTVFAGDPAFVPQLDFMELQRIDPGHAPFFKFGEAAFFVAYRDGKPVGRISAQVNRRHLEQYRDSTGHFGFFDCIDDQAVADALLAQAADWLRQRGMTRMVGPYNFSLNDECGCLVEGFDTPPAILMPHARRWTGGLIERAGLTRQMDLFVYRAAPAIPPRMEKLIERARRIGDISLRKFDMKRYTQEIELLVEIFNDAWSGNWGFVPFDRAEIDALAAELKPFFRNEYGRFMLVDGKVVGVIVALPDLNGIIKPFGGKLLPFNWAKLIWALKRETWRSARIPLMGLRREWHATPQAGGLLALMVKALADQARERYHLDWVEYSSILEVNKPMIALAETMAGLPVKTYRVYGKAI